MGLIQDWVGGERSLTAFRDDKGVGFRNDRGQSSGSGAYRNVSLEFLDGFLAPNAIDLHLKISRDSPASLLVSVSEKY